MELPEELLRGIYAYGFEKPSAIQQRAIKPTILGRDLIAQAQSGTVRITFANALAAWSHAWWPFCDLGDLSGLEGRGEKRREKG